MVKGIPGRERRINKSLEEKKLSSFLYCILSLHGKYSLVYQGGA